VEGVVEVERAVGVLRGGHRHQPPVVARLALLPVVQVKPHHCVRVLFPHNSNKNNNNSKNNNNNGS